MGAPFKMKGSPFQRNFGIGSPLNQQSCTDGSCPDFSVGGSKFWRGIGAWWQSKRLTWKKKSDSISAMTYDKSSKHLRIMGKTGDVGYIPVNLRGGKLSLSGDRRMSLVKGMDFSGGLSAIDKYNKMSLNAPKFKASTAYKRYGTIDYKGDYYLSK